VLYIGGVVVEGSARGTGIVGIPTDFMPSGTALRGVPMLGRVKVVYASNGNPLGAAFAGWRDGWLRVLYADPAQDSAFYVGGTFTRYGSANVSTVGVARLTDLTTNITTSVASNSTNATFAAVPASGGGGSALGVSDLDDGGRLWAEVRALAVFNGSLVVGGTFSALAGASAVTAAGGVDAFAGVRDLGNVVAFKLLA
jgi:hypothetical protein